MHMEEVKKFGVAYFLAWGPEGRAKVDIFLPYELVAQSVGWLAGCRACRQLACFFSLLIGCFLRLTEENGKELEKRKFYLN